MKHSFNVAASFLFMTYQFLSTYAKGVDLYMANVTYNFSCLNRLRGREEILASC